jgi:hypothetical protein
MTGKDNIVLFEPDLLFSSKVEAVARKLNIDLKVVTSRAELLHEWDEGAAKGYIISLDSLEGELPVLGKYANDVTNVVGYYSHVKTHLADEAERAGIRTALSRGAFAARMQETLTEMSSKQRGSG